MSNTPPNDARSDRERVDHLHHEVGNDLSVIRGRAQLMRRRLDHPDALNAQTLPALLAQLAAIDAAVLRVITAMDAFVHAAGAHGEPPPATSDTRSLDR